jgi:hypothetical protein
MNRGAGIPLLAIGLLLLLFALKSSRSLASELSELFDGSPSEKTIVLLIAGLICTAIGASSLFPGRSKK